MADLDTAEKRASSLNFQKLWRVNPEFPQGLYTVDERLGQMGLYGFIIPAAPASFIAAWARGCNKLLKNGGHW